jgi:cytosine/adenosine deaminase-related metal-dependent hydrolase
MRSAGVAVGVGLDGHGLDDDQDYWRELRLAYTLGNMGSALTPHPSPSWRGESGHAQQFSNTEYSPLTPAAVLTMGTVTGAAITLGEGIPLGRLAEGALADMMLVDWQALRGAWCPDDLPTEAGLLDFLLHRAQPEHIRQVMVNGEWVVREGRSTRVDIDAVQAEIRARLNAQDVSVRQQNQQKAVALAHYVRRFYTGWIE